MKKLASMHQVNLPAVTSPSASSSPFHNNKKRGTTIDITKIYDRTPRVGNQRDSLGLSDVLEHVIGSNLNERYSSLSSIKLFKPIQQSTQNGPVQKRIFINHVAESRLSSTSKHKPSACTNARELIKARNKHHISLDVNCNKMTD